MFEKTVFYTVVKILFFFIRSKHSGYIIMMTMGCGHFTAVLRRNVVPLISR